MIGFRGRSGGRVDIISLMGNKLIDKRTSIGHSVLGWKWERLNNLVILLNGFVSRISPTTMKLDSSRCPTLCPTGHADG